MKYNSSEQSISWFREQYRGGTLTIQPPYQRKPVWAERQKSSLIESILLELPVPEVFVQETVDDEGSTRFAIVDGQQRIRTVLQFIGAETDPGEEEANNFALSALSAQSPWVGRTLADLGESDFKRFFSYKFAVQFLATDDESEVRGLFARLNKYLLPLTAAELRNATYTGPFAALCNQLADDEYWASNEIVTAAAIRRMQDIEFAADLLIGVMHGPQDGSSATIDEYYSQYEDFEDEFPEQKRSSERFEKTLGNVQRLFPGIRTTRWSNKADFYSLFVFLAYASLQSRSVTGIRDKFEQFSDEIDKLRGNPDAKVPAHVAHYVRSLERGANGKTRRAARHSALLAALRPLLKD